MGTPYRFGGDSDAGFDCSGLVRHVYGRVAIRTARTAQAQSTQGRWVALDELQPGDLLFFGGDREKLHHVGVVSSGSGEPLRMIHASSSRGVIETELGASSYWLARLRFARRLAPSP